MYNYTLVWWATCRMGIFIVMPYGGNWNIWILLFLMMADIGMSVAMHLSALFDFVLSYKILTLKWKWHLTCWYSNSYLIERSARNNISRCSIYSVYFSCFATSYVVSTDMSSFACWVSYIFVGGNINEAERLTLILMKVFMDN